MFLTDLIFDIY